MNELPWMPVLMYHRIVEHEPATDPNRICTSVARLEAHLDQLAARSYSAVPLDLALGPTHPAEGRRFAITFDDGYEETLRLALPVLAARSLPAIVFVVSGRVGGRATWNADPARLLTRGELLELQAAGIFIGSHAQTHRRLSTLSDREVQEEVGGSKAMLEQMLGTAVRFIAYPHHDFDSRTESAVAAAGYAGAAGGRSGSHSRFNLHRIDAGRLGGRQLWLHVTGLHRWARRQPLPAPVRRVVSRWA